MDETEPLLMGETEPVSSEVEREAKRIKQEEEDANLDSDIIASGIVDPMLSSDPEQPGASLGLENPSAEDPSKSTNPDAAAGATDPSKAKKKKPKPKEKTDKKDSAGKASDKDKEFEVPLAAINKILKASLPEGAICTKDAKSAFSKAAGIFVLYITACANDMAKGHKRQTINAQDITNALNELGYASFLPHLDATLEKMKAEAAARKSQKDSQKKDKKPEESAAGMVDGETLSAEVAAAVEASAQTAGEGDLSVVE